MHTCHGRRSEAQKIRCVRAGRFQVFLHVFKMVEKKQQANKKDLKTSIKYLNYEDSFFSFIFSHQLMFIYMSTTSNNGRLFCRVFSHFCPRNIL